MLTNPIDFIGKSFGKWTVIELAGKDKKSNKLIKCRCTCGFERINRFDVITTNKSTQCKSCYIKKLNEVESIIGNKFGKWIVLSQIKNHLRNEIYYICKCECGNQKQLTRYNLRNNRTNSCANCRVKTHGMSYTSTFRTWRDMIGRCNNINHKSYKYYGARGISVCESWKLFENFYRDMGNKPDGLQIDRINNDGNYEPSNCRWVTPAINNSNRRCSKNIGE